jgi:hypothetical protein
MDGGIEPDGLAQPRRFWAMLAVIVAVASFLSHAPVKGDVN